MENLPATCVLLAIVACMPALAAPGQGGRIRLAEGGKALCSIVVPPDALELEQLAARELADHLEQVVGDRPPVVDAATEGTRILVGRSADIEQMVADVDLAALGTDGIVMHTVGDSLVLTGGLDSTNGGTLDGRPRAPWTTAAGPSPRPTSPRLLWTLAHPPALSFPGPPPPAPSRDPSARTRRLQWGRWAGNGPRPRAIWEMSVNTIYDSTARVVERGAVHGLAQPWRPRQSLAPGAYESEVYVGYAHFTKE